jgi:hypothetical protein
MPPRGKCWSCGEIAFLTAKVLENKETGRWYCMMVCCKCKRFYESGGIETEGDSNERSLLPEPLKEMERE